MDWYFVGVDFGQSRDFTAIAVVERAETTGEWDAVMFAWKKVVSLQLRYLERIALGTPYPEVVERVVQVTRSPDSDRPMPAGGGWHGSGPAGGGSAAEGGARLRSDGGKHHERPEADGRGRVLRGPEAGFDPGLTGAAATRGAADRGRIGARSGPGEGDGGDAGEDLALRPRAVRGVAGRDARRPGVCGSAGMLERAECVSRTIRRAGSSGGRTSTRRTRRGYFGRRRNEKDAGKGRRGLVWKLRQRRGGKEDKMGKVL